MRRDHRQKSIITRSYQPLCTRRETDAVGGGTHLLVRMNAGSGIGAARNASAVSNTTDTLRPRFAKYAAALYVPNTPITQSPRRTTTHHATLQVSSHRTQQREKQDTHSCALFPPPTTSTVPQSRSSVDGFTASRMRSASVPSAEECTTGPRNPRTEAVSGVSAGGMCGMWQPWREGGVVWSGREAGEKGRRGES